MELLLFFALGIGAGLIVKKSVRIEPILDITLIILVFAMGVQAGQVKIENHQVLVFPIVLMIFAIGFSVALAWVALKLVRGGR